MRSFTARRPAPRAVFWLRGVPVIAVFLALSVPGQAAQAASDDARSQAAAEIARIDVGMPGTLGVYIKWLSDGHEIRHRVDRSWYLASTIKIPLAVAILRGVEAGEFSLRQQLVLTESDLVDGSGSLLYARPGSQFTIDELLRSSIEDSDSTASDMLLGLLGEEPFNQQVDELFGAGQLGRVTKILQVRYDVYAMVHADAAMLSNRDILELFQVESPQARYAALIRMLGVSPDTTAAGSLAEAFERYYDTGANSGSLIAMGDLLERLVAGELLSREHTDRLLRDMLNVTTGDQRIKAGLGGVAFAHKTGTQIERACDVGVLNPLQPEQAVIVAACAEKFGSIRHAERAFEGLGRMLHRYATLP